MSTAVTRGETAPPGAIVSGCGPAGYGGTGGAVRDRTRHGVGALEPGPVMRMGYGLGPGGGA